MKIVEIREKKIPFSSSISNSVISFSEMTGSIVAVITDVVRDGKPVVGLGFNSIGRYAQSNIIRERLIPRIMKANPVDVLNDKGTNFSPEKIS